MAKAKSGAKNNNATEGDVHAHETQSPLDRVLAKKDAEEVVASDIQVENQAVLEAAVVKSADDAQDADTDKGDAKKTTKTTKSKAKDKKADLKDAAADLADDVKAVVQDAKTEAAQAAKAVQDGANDLKGKAKEKAKDALDDTKAALDAPAAALQDKARAAKDDLIDAKDAVVETVKSAADDLKAQGEEGKKQWSKKLAHAKSYAEQVVDNLKDNLDRAKQKAQDSAHEGKQKLAQIKQKAQKNADDFSQKASDLGADLSEQAKQASDEIKDKAQASIEEAKAFAEQQSQTVKQSLEEGKEELVERVERAKEFAEDYQKEHKVRGFAGKLGLVGAYTASFYQKNNAYKSLNLSDENEKLRLKQQGRRLIENMFGQRVLGQKSSKAIGLANRLLPSKQMDRASDALYSKLAQWASQWAQKDLAWLDRKALQDASDEQRQLWAEEVRNQNRALALLGGVSGLMGLKGVLVDAAWLLMVALKSVYQLAIVYDKPLKGREGIDVVYGILSACDLGKIQEKQAIMIALALGDGVLKNAQQTGLATELQKLGSQYQNRSYSAQFEEISKHIDLDKLNPKWLHCILPIGSMAVSAHYNSALIDEVLGVACATFADQDADRPLLADKSDSDKADK